MECTSKLSARKHHCPLTMWSEDTNVVSDSMERTQSAKAAFSLASYSTWLVVRRRRSRNQWNRRRSPGPLSVWRRIQLGLWSVDAKALSTTSSVASALLVEGSPALCFAQQNRCLQRGALNWPFHCFRHLDNEGRQSAQICCALNFHVLLAFLNTLTHLQHHLKTLVVNVEAT